MIGYFELQPSIYLPGQLDTGHFDFFQEGLGRGSSVRYPGSAASLLTPFTSLALQCTATSLGEDTEKAAEEDKCRIINY